MQSRDMWVRRYAGERYVGEKYDYGTGARLA
jgi:hypothetical protein